VILGRNKSMIGCSNLWLPIVMWVFTFIICDLSLTSNTRYILIFGVMVVQIRFQKQRISLKRKSVNEPGFS
jgi:hypothetical protein